ncbi:MAG: polyphenol oxidase family protein [Verrucomicrobiae bacterium]|nr:polyphenol oxidase family protein [Verrucomicrobiae bacterium]
MTPTLLSFEPFETLPWLAVGMVLRVPGVSPDLPREKLREDLSRHHAKALDPLGISWQTMCMVEQVHGCRIIEINQLPSATQPLSEADGMATRARGIALGIHTADCCPVFLADPVHRAIGLLHSGRRGSEAGIAAAGVNMLTRMTGGQPADLIAVLGPCIHACCYDTNFLVLIEKQLRQTGVEKVWIHPECTGCHVDRYYSYRKESGRTGRMLSFMMIR